MCYCMDGYVGLKKRAMHCCRCVSIGIQILAFEVCAMHYKELSDRQGNFTALKLRGLPYKPRV